MTNLKKLLALVLVVAMTVTMLPVFAAAEDVAVETVAPVANVPAAAAAPAVEDISFIPEIAPAAPVEAIETAPTEAVPVKAELQVMEKGASFDNDDLALDEGYFLKLTVKSVGTMYYNSLSSAATDITNNVAGSATAGTLTFLSDYTAYSTTDTSTPLLNINTAASATSYVTIDLNGHILTAQLGRPLIGRSGGYIGGITVKNGTIVYQNIGRTTEYNGAIYSYANYPTTTGGTSLLTTSIKLIDLTMISLAHVGDTAKVAPAICSRIWKTTVTLTDSKVIAEETPAIKFFPISAYPSGKDAETVATLNKSTPLACSVVMNGDCAVGTLAADTAAVRMSYPTSLQALEGNTAKLQLKITPDSQKRSVFLGSAIASYSGDPEDATRFEKILPADYTEVGTYSLALPDPSSFFPDNSAAEDVQPGWNEPSDYSAIMAPACPHASKAHVDAVPATYTATGMAEHWYCADCGTYWAADGVTETTAADLVLPIAACPHANKAHVDAVAPTYAAAGTVEHYYCADCGTYWAADEVTEITAADLTGDPKLVDATGKSDAELVELGAVTKATAPDGSATAYNGIENAIKKANEWTEPGGEVKLLRDYSLYNGTNTSSEYYTIGVNTSTYHAYDATIRDDLYGYWLNLDGHTLAVRCQRGFLGLDGAGAINIKNGSIFYHNETGSSGAIKGLITIGATTTAPYLNNALRTARVTLHNAELVATHASSDGGTAKDAIYSAVWSNVVRLYDSKVISRYGSGVCFFLSNSKITDETDLADIRSHGVQEIVELHGDSVLGSLSSSTSPIRYQSFDSNSKPDNYAGTYEGIDHVVTVTADATCRFLGSSATPVKDSSGAKYVLTVNLPEGDISTFTSYAYARPDPTTYPAATAADVVPARLAAGEYSGFNYGAHMHNKAHVDAVPATYTQTGMAEHYYCADCGTYWAADGETETTAEALVLPIEACPHASKTHVDAVPATYTETGTAEHWYCADCGTYWKADGVTETTTEELVLPIAACPHANKTQIAEVPATYTETGTAEHWHCEDCGVDLAADGMTVTTLEELVLPIQKDDAGAVAAGYVMCWDKNDGTYMYYDNPKTAVSTASKATSAAESGTLRLLRDYTGVDTASAASAAEWLNYGGTNNYTNVDPADGSEFKGFWLDLGGHTLTYHGKHPMIGRNAGFSNVNIKNGTMIYANAGRTGANIGMCVFGVTTSAPGSGSTIYTTTLRVKDATMISLGYTADEDPGKWPSPIFSSTLWSNVVNVHNSRLIAAAAPAVIFAKSSATINETLENAINESGANCVVNTYGDCVVGALDNNPAVFFKKLGGTAVTQNMIVTADSVNTIFLGKAVTGNSSAINITEPTTIGGNAVERSAASYTFALPDAAQLAAETTLDAKPGDLAAQEYPGFSYGLHVHDKQHFDAVAPTYAAAGNYEYYYCAACGTYFAADGETETTLDALTIPALTCTHAGYEMHDESPATYAVAGNIAYWYCPNCGKYFSDDECTNEVAESDVFLAKLTDATGKTDAELVALGAVVKATDPDGTAFAYGSVVDAYTRAYTWKEAGGELRLLTDYEWIDNATANVSGFIGSSILPTESAYDNTEVETMPTKGFWFDLGGHTLTAQLGKAMYWSDYTRYINIKNGTIIYQNTARGSAMIFGAITCGYTSNAAIYTSTHEVYNPTVNLYNMKFYSLPALNGAQNASVIASSRWNTTVNIRDSVVVAANNQNAIEFHKSSAKVTDAGDLAAVQALGINYNVDIQGVSTVGSTGGAPAIMVSRISGGTYENIPHQATVTASEDTIFIGSTPVKNDVSSLYTVTKPEDLVNTKLEFDFEEIGVVVQNLNSFIHRSKLPADSSRATYTPDGGAQSAEMTFSEAVQAWRSSGRNGTVKLLGNLEGSDTVRTRETIGGKVDYKTTSTTTGYTSPVMLLLDEAEKGGKLTIDLNGNTVDSADGAFLATTAALSDFELTVVNGTLTGSAHAVFFLFGSGVGVTMENLKVSGSGIYGLFDYRVNSSWSILRGCEFEMEDKACVEFITNEETRFDTSLVYYSKDCSFKTLNNASIRPIHFGRGTSEWEYREFNWIVDGDNTYVSRYSHATHGPGFRGFSRDIEAAIYMDIGGTVGTKDETAPFTWTTDASATLLTDKENAAAVVTFRDVTLYFKRAADAIVCAEKLARSAKLDVTATLVKDADAAATIGAPGRVSAFALDLNGQGLPAEGLIQAAGGAGTEITITVTGKDGMRSVKLFKGVSSIHYTEGGEYVIRKGSLLENYSLNLEDNVKINLYAAKDTNSVGYVQDGKEHIIPGKDDFDAWVVDTLAAKEMSKKIDVFAAKTENGKTVLDFACGVSVKGYVDSDPAAAYEGAFAQTLSATLQTLMIYGKYAEKYFAGDYTAITADELTAIGLTQVPETDTTNLVHADRAVTGMADYTTDNTATSGFYGTAAVLEDSISLKLYFYGAEFEDATAKIGDADATLEKQGEHYVVKAKISAKDFDNVVTVALTAADGTTALGSVTDSAEAYTARVAENENAYKLVQALRAYGADAKRFAEAKG